MNNLGAEGQQPVEIKIPFTPKNYSLDTDNFEYLEIRISEVTKSLLLQAKKELDEGTLDKESPRGEKALAAFGFIEKTLPEMGFECYEIAYQSGFEEIKRFRRPIK